MQNANCFLHLSIGICVHEYKTSVIFVTVSTISKWRIYVYEHLKDTHDFHDCYDTCQTGSC